MVGMLLALVLVVLAIKYGSLWLQAYWANADVRLLSLVGMSLRQVPPRLVVTAKIMGRQAGLSIDRQQGMSTERLEAHVLAGGDLKNVLSAIIAAHRAGMVLDFDRAAAIDLAGRDVLEAVQTSVSPKVIDCPDANASGKVTLSAVARNGVELRVRARVTVRTNLDQLIGGATEETIIARVGQGIITAIGTANSHMEVMAMPDRISKGVLASGLDTNTAYEIVSIDIADIDIGENIGARLQSEQADADSRMARAKAEIRRAEAVAYHQQMRTEVTRQRALLVRAEATLPVALGEAFRAGSVHIRSDADSGASPSQGRFAAALFGHGMSPGQDASLFPLS